MVGISMWFRCSPAQDAGIAPRRLSAISRLGLGADGIIRAHGHLPLRRPRRAAGSGETPAPTAGSPRSDAVRRRLQSRASKPPTTPPRPAAAPTPGPPTPRRALALLVLLDQMPRNAWRGSGRMFATDGKCSGHRSAAVDAGLDRQVEPALRPVLLPALHAFGISLVRPGARLARARAPRSMPTPSASPGPAPRRIVARFGRFPHRNAAIPRPPHHRRGAEAYLRPRRLHRLIRRTGPRASATPGRRPRPVP